MTWTQIYIYEPTYEYTNTNQHGNRYKQVGRKQIKVCRMAAKIGNAADIQTLVLLSHTLEVPVCYDFGEGKAFITVRSAG